MKDKTALDDQVQISLGRGCAAESSLSITGRVRLELRGPDGKTKAVREMSNLVVTVGKEYILDVWEDHDSGAGAPPTAMTSMKLGTDGTAPAIGNTTVGAYIAGSVLSPFTSVTQNTSTQIRYVTDWPAGAALLNIVEAGIFNNVADNDTGTMLARTTFAVINKLAADTLSITWDIEIT